MITGIGEMINKRVVAYTGIIGAIVFPCHGTMNILLPYRCAYNPEI